MRHSWEKDLTSSESEYYAWMSERFGKAFQDRMEAEQPGWLAQKRDYEDAKRYFEEYQRNEYLRLVNNAVCEIRGLTDRYESRLRESGKEI